MASSKGSKICLGVDLGTTFTAGAVRIDGRVEPLSLSHRGHSIASVVAIDGDDVVVGDAAELRIAAEPRSGVREPKRRLGDTTPFVIAGKPHGAEKLMGHLLASVVASATERHGSPPDEVVLAHPANWGEYKLDLLREAGRLAGVADVELVPEPVAAALSYVEAGKVSAGDTVAVFDFGGGTFDAAVVEVGPEGCVILGTPEGLERMGGVDLDAAVLAHVNESVDGRLSELDASDPAVARGMGALRSACTAAKEALSTDSEASIPVNLPGLSTEVRITREELETSLRGRIGDTLSSLDRAVASAGKDYGDLAGVLLVGGTSRIPMVAEAVASHTGRPVLRDADAKLAIASGAAGGLGPISHDGLGAAVGGDAAGSGGSDKAGGGTDADKAAKGAGTSSIKEGAAGRTKEGLGAKAKKAASKVTPGKAAAGVAAAAAATAAGVAAATAAGALGGDDDDADQVDPEAVEPDDESMDAFDDSGPSGGGGSSGGGGGGGGAGASGGGGGPAPARGGAGTATSQRPPSADSMPRADEPQPAPGTSSPPTGGPVAGSGGSRSELEAVRQNALAQLAEWSPDGADPEQAAEVRAELIAMVERYQPAPGQTVADAIEDLKDQVADRTGDYANEIRLDAVIEEQRRQREEDRQEERDEAEFQRQVDESRSELTERVLAWEPPEGLDPEGAEEFRGDLLAILENYVPVPGSSFEQAEYELRRRFNERARDYRQDVQIDAQTLAIEDGHAPDETEEQDGTTPGDDGEVRGETDPEDETETDPAGHDDTEGEPSAEDAEAQAPVADVEPGHGVDTDTANVEPGHGVDTDTADGGDEAPGLAPQEAAVETRLTADVFDDFDDEVMVDTGEDALGSPAGGEAIDPPGDALGVDLVEEDVESLPSVEPLASEVEQPAADDSLSPVEEPESLIGSDPEFGETFVSTDIGADPDITIDEPDDIASDEPDLDELDSDDPGGFDPDEDPDGLGPV